MKLKWQQAPGKTQWGDEMVVASVAIDKDHTLSLFCKRAQAPKVEAMFAQRTEQDVPEASCGNTVPVGWLESPDGVFRANPLYKIKFPSKLLSWQMPLYMALPEQEPERLEEMWAALAAYQPQADAAGHGETWARMCRERTADAATDAYYAAAAAAADAAYADAAYYAAARVAAVAAADAAGRWAQTAIDTITTASASNNQKEKNT